MPPHQHGTIDRSKPPSARALDLFSLAPVVGGLRDVPPPSARGVGKAPVPSPTPRDDAAAPAAAPADPPATPSTPPAGPDAPAAAQPRPTYITLPDAPTYPGPTHSRPAPSPLPPSRQAPSDAGREWAPPIDDDGWDRAPPPHGASTPRSPGRGRDARAAEAAGPLSKVSGRLVRLVFAREPTDAEPTGFRVYLIKAGRDDVRIATEVPVQAEIGDQVVATGRWETRNGRDQLKAQTILKDLPVDEAGIRLWIRKVEGIGAATAARIVKRWGDRSREAIGDPDRIVEAGIPRRKAEMIAEAWRADEGHNELLVWLGDAGIKPSNIQKIMFRFGHACRDKIEANPYAVCDVIEGIGFVTVDGIARRVGLALDSPQRIRAALVDVLREARNAGNCGLPPDRLVASAVHLLEPIDEALVRAGVDAALDGKHCTLDELTGLAMPNNMIEAESEFSERLLGLDAAMAIDAADAARAVASAEKALGVRLDPSQRAAAVTAVSSNVSVITGGPGSGKTTTMRAVIRAMRDLGRSVVACAPTGRAAKRLYEATGVDASTIHRLLSYEEGSPAFGPEKPFDEDCFVIDESSMMDITLARSFIRAVRPGSIVVFVGDEDQLPSVGAGQVLRDMIASGAVTVARLDQVHRQEGDSGIVEAARRINAGLYPIPDGERFNGFAVIRDDTVEGMVDRIVRYVSAVIPGRGFDPLADVQVLAAQRRGEGGVNHLNTALKAALNPPRGPDHTVSLRNAEWSVGDRIMQTRNNYAKRVYNGEIGTITWVGKRTDARGKDEICFKVNYGGVEASYGPRDVDEVELAYATTVHKSQGCEFPWVLVACPPGHIHMLDRNLLYTAVTRAKTSCLIVGSPENVRKAAAGRNRLTRHTGLAARLSPRPPAPRP